MNGYKLSPKAAQQEQAWIDSLARKSIIGANGELASRYDGTNFRTNMVTVAEYNDSAVANAAGVMGLSTAWACVRLVAGTISSLPLMVYQEGRDGREIASKHPLYRVLHDSPNADQTALNFWQFVSAAIELQGNGYAEIQRANDGRVVALAVPFAPDFVTPRRLSSGAIEYKVADRAQPIAQENMLHVRGFGGNPLGGLSTLSFGRKTFGLAMGIEQAAAGTFRNGILPSGVMTTDKAFQGTQRKEAEALLVEKYQGAMRAGVPMLLDNGLKWESITINPDDAQMLESRSFSVEEICRFFSVPPHMIGHTEKASSWGTGIEQMTLAFVKFSLRERLKNIESTLEKQLLSPVERAAGMRIEFNIEGLLRGDSKARAEFYQAALGDTQKPGWMVRNEIRKLENLTPIDGWDEPIELFQQSTATTPGETP